MSEENKPWSQGDRAEYHGIATVRHGQEVEVVGVGELISAKFPDGRILGCASHSLRKLGG